MQFCWSGGRIRWLTLAKKTSVLCDINLHLMVSLRLERSWDVEYSFIAIIPSSTV